MNREAFESFKTQAKQKKTGGFYKLVAPGTVGESNTYRVRILPPKKAGTQPLVDFQEHYFQSPITGEWINGVCPKTDSQPCPLCNQNRNMWKRAKDENNDKLKNIVKNYFNKEKTLIAVSTTRISAIQPSILRPTASISSSRSRRRSLMKAEARRQASTMTCPSSPARHLR
jgi:hypothetical protein